MQRGTAGRYEITDFGGEQIRAFIPHPLPPNPPLELFGDRQRLLERATLALGRLDSITLLLPDPNLFLYAYVRREAVLSSQIEGTQSSLAQLLLFELDEAPGLPFDDVQEVSNYVAALEHGMNRLREDFPLSNRLSAKCTPRYSRTAGEANNPPVSFAARKTGSAARARGMPTLSPAAGLCSRLYGGAGALHPR